MTQTETIKRLKKLEEFADAIKSEARVLLTGLNAPDKPKKISKLQLSLNEMNRARRARITKPKTA